VTTPSVGRPAPPDSIEAALAREAFTPYAELGESTSDGLALSSAVDQYRAAYHKELGKLSSLLVSTKPTDAFAAVSAAQARAATPTPRPTGS